MSTHPGSKSNALIRAVVPKVLLTKSPLFQGTYNHYHNQVAHARRPGNKDVATTWTSLFLSVDFDSVPADRCGGLAGLSVTNDEYCSVLETHAFYPLVSVDIDSPDALWGSLLIIRLPTTDIASELQIHAISALNCEFPYPQVCGDWYALGLTKSDSDNGRSFHQGGFANCLHASSQDLEAILRKSNSTIA